MEIISHFTFSSIFFSRSLEKFSIKYFSIFATGKPAYMGIFLRSPQSISPSSLVNQTSKSFSTPSKNEVVLTILLEEEGTCNAVLLVLSWRMPKEQWSKDSWLENEFCWAMENHQIIILLPTEKILQLDCIFSGRHWGNDYWKEWTCIFFRLDGKAFLLFDILLPFAFP